MNDAVALGTVLITIYIVWAGVAYLMSPINAEGRQKARSRLLNAVLGLLIMLGAWLLIDSIMKVIYNSNQFGPWNSILNDSNAGDNCIAPRATPTSVASITSSTNASGGTVTTGQSTTASSGAGTCSVPSSGPCSASSLANSCFGSTYASQAGEICAAESGGNSSNLSRSDVTNDGHSYSVGLFQINITNSFKQTVDGQNCSAAFSGVCQGSNVVQSGSSAGHCSVTVKNAQLYNDCVAAAENPTNNVNGACALNNDGSSGWGRWSTSKICNL
jgi:hypothetical protein